MTLGIDECWFPQRTALTAYNYGCRCARCNPRRKRYDGRRTPKPRRRVRQKGVPPATPAPPTRPTQSPAWTYYCSCEAPIVKATGLVPGASQCQRCGKPPLATLSKGTT